MQSLELNRKESGKIWSRKPSPSSDNGLMLKISHSKSLHLGSKGHTIRFLEVAFDSGGDRFLAGDHQGNIYLFDLSRNRYQLVQKTGISSTALAFTLRRKTEYLVGLADCSLKCFDVDSRAMVAWMKGHSSPVHSISIHAAGRYALTTSNDTALLWDLDTFTRKRKLNIKEAVGISKVFFLPLSNVIMTCFRDDSVFAWESDTLQCKYQLPAAEGANPGYKAFSTPRDGRLLVAGGMSRFLHVWSLDTRSLLRVVEMPSKVKVIKQVEFLPESFDGGASQIVGVLSQDGIVRFVHIHNCKLLFDVGTLDDRIQMVAVSPAGRHIVTTTESGILQVYSVPALMTDYNRPPPPLVKAVGGSRLRSKDGRSISLEPSKIKNETRREKNFNRNGHFVGREEEEDGQEMEHHVFSALPEGMDLKKLQNILIGFGEYPEKYRMFIWRSLLRLPENHSAFSSLIDRGTHLAWAKLHEDYPIKSRRLLRVLQRTLSSLAHWSAIFGELEYLPMLAFPFVKLFQNNQLICFEVVATVLANWCQHWFEFFPNPPINVLSSVENILAFHDKKLLQHFVTYNISSQVYAWPLLHTLMSEVLTKEDWLKLWDNVLSQNSSFFLFAIVSYLMNARRPLLQCTDVDDFNYYFHHCNAVNISSVIKDAYNLKETTPEDIIPGKDQFKPLTKGQYPIFNKYPKFVVDYQTQERDKIRRDELDYLHQRQAAAELERELEKRRQAEETWYREQEVLRAAEEQRWRLMAEEEQKIADQKIRLQALKRELRMKELQLLDAARQRFMTNQKKDKHKELARLDREINRKVRLREQETQSALDAVEIRRFELEAQKQLLQQELAKEAVDAEKQTTGDGEVQRRREAEMKEKTEERNRDNQTDLLHNERKSLQAAMAHSDLNQTQAEFTKQKEYRKRLDDLDRDLRSIELNELNDQNDILERQIHGIMHEITETKRDKTSRLEQEYKDVRLMASRNANNNHGNNSPIDLEMEGSFKPYPDDAELSEGQVPSSPDGRYQVSLDRGRHTLERKEHNLMREVKEMRQRIARRDLQDEITPFSSEDNDYNDDVR
ncbi:TBC1 domain family member 31-like [Apostichopus japonicus]|uniref:TBC1 domain family member 31-like n=1 Tax=Stichopus japonicus TaxID=307972 RepID=UPI003AB70B05